MKKKFQIWYTLGKYLTFIKICKISRWGRDNALVNKVNLKQNFIRQIISVDVPNCYVLKMCDVDFLFCAKTKRQF